MIEPIIHIIGPGGAGKSSAAALLAKKFGWPCIDLDRHFLDNTGDIAHYINQRGYAAYARQNVLNYLTIMGAVNTAAVVVLSSGFMTYPTDIDPRYCEIRGKIERHPYSALLLPSFDLEECVEIVVKRQLLRPDLSASREQEEARLRSRFPLFMALQCNRFLSSASPAQVAADIQAFLMAQFIPTKAPNSRA